MQFIEHIIGILLFALYIFVIWLPAWWLTSTLDSRVGPNSLMRVPLSVGLALIGYLTFVNLLGELLENGAKAAITYFVLNLLFCAILLWKNNSHLGAAFIWQKKRTWVGVLIVSILLAVPQWFQATSTNRWDEVASSSIHITAPNQFAEGVYPPRHNAFPDIVIKYHYAFTILSGTVHWISKLSSNISIDVASTALWLFTFLFAYAWIRQLGLTRMAAGWGGFSILMGSGLSWLYLPWLRAYEGWQKNPSESALIHSYDPGISWWENLVKVMKNQSVYLENSSGEIFNLPFDIAIHYQQHAIAAGIALTLVAAYVFWLWQTKSGFRPVLLIVNIFCFGLVFLGHAVFGAVASASAGLTMLVLWLLRPSWSRFHQGILFTLGVTLIAFLHGGMLAMGDEYGSGAPIAIRDSLGFISGSLIDQVNWTLASYGLLFIFTLLSIWTWIHNRPQAKLKSVYLVFFGLFALVSFMIPQMVFFSHEGGIEEQTEITKFFYCTRFALALLSVGFVDWLSRRVRWWTLTPFFIMLAVSPVAVSVAAVLDEDGRWVGFYSSPYDWTGGRNYKAAGEALKSLKNGGNQQYYDFSMSEPASGHLNELLTHGGSVFTLSPTRYEVTGFGFLIAEDRVADRILHESRMARLLPGAAEASGTDWLYTVENRVLARRPTVVRSRFAKMVSENLLELRSEAGGRQLFELKPGTTELDLDLEKFWAPKIITQAHSDLNGDGNMDLVFFNLNNKTLSFDRDSIELDTLLESVSEIPLVYLARFPGNENASLVLGHLSDANYSRGKTISDLVRQYPFSWQRLDSMGDSPGRKYQYGFWGLPTDVPLFADHDGDGFDSHIQYRSKTNQWFLYPNRRLDGPRLPETSSPLPFAGRFIPGSTGDLGVWSPVNGQVRIKSTSSGESASASWGGREGDILVPGDYDGDGYDELAVWQSHTQIWWIRKMPSGPNSGYEFGTASGIPLPADYNNDGKIDLAYWEPKLETIYVSFDSGQTVARTIEVPPHSIPVFVHMY